MREFLNKNGMVVFVVVILLAGVIWFFFGRGPRTPDLSRGFFVDEDTGEESTLKMTEFPPRTNPKTGKPTLVQEFKYTCDGGKTVKVAYYQKYSDGTKKQLDETLAKTGSMTGTDVTNSTYVRSPEKGSKWALIGSSEGSAAARLTCPTGEAEIVLP